MTTTLHPPPVDNDQRRDRATGHPGPGRCCPNGRNSAPCGPPSSTLLIAIVVMIGLGAMFAAITASQSTGFEPGATAISTSLTGTFFAQLAVGVLGVLLITGEYSTGMIRSSLTVVPSRLPMLWGKLAVFAVTVFLTMLAASFARRSSSARHCSATSSTRRCPTRGRCVRFWVRPCI